MAPTAAIQARIAAFEGKGSSKDLPENTVPFSEFTDSQSESNPSLSPTTSSFPPSSPPKSIDHSPSMTSSCRTSVIDLKDWVIDDGPGVLPSALRESGSSMNGGVRSKTTSPSFRPTMGRKSPPNYDLDSTPLINFESSPPKSRVKVPPLPPRKPSLQSLRPPSSPIVIGSNTSPKFGASSKGSQMLKPPEADHSYPPNLSELDVGKRGGHAPASSISSFHSLSLSSDGGTSPGSLTNFMQHFPMDKEKTSERDRDRDWHDREGDGDSLNDSFEDVSAPSSFSPTNTFIPPSRNPFVKPTPPPRSKSQSRAVPPPAEPPKLPQRPKPRVSAPTSITSTASAPILPTSSSSNTVTGRGFTSSPTSPAGSRITSPVLTPVASTSAQSTGSGSNSSATSHALRRIPPPPPISSSSSHSHAHAHAHPHAHTPTHTPPPSHISRSKPPSRNPLASGSASASASASASTSDRSSILSHGSTSSRTSLNTHTAPPKHYSNNYTYNFKGSGFSARPSAPPLEARVRYDAVFDANVRAKQKAAASGPLLSPLSAGSGMKRSMRQNAGWRGLSVDLITDNPTQGEKERSGSKASSKEGDLKEEYEIVEKDASLDGKVVKMIWQKSKLEKSKLRDIWTECDPHSQGSLDRQAFALGMWRIDTELDKAQKARRAALLSSANSRSFRPGGRHPKRMDSGGSISLIQM